MSTENGKKNIIKLCVTALFVALAFVATMYISVPIPLGYANLGGSILLFAGFYFGGKIGFAVGGIGSALADLALGYAIWAPFTLVIKGAAGFVAGFSKKNDKPYSVKSIVAAIVSMIVVVAGYVVGGAIIEMISGAALGAAIVTGIASAPALLLEALINLVVFMVLASATQAAGLKKVINRAM